MSSRAPAATTTMLRARETAGAAGTDHLWGKAAELERDFAGYKRRLAERRAHAVAEVAGRAGGGEEGVGDAAGRGRRYEEYVRRRDERLRQEWRARMERKEAEVQALWARLDRTGSRGSRRRGGDHDGGELAAAASHAREDQVRPPQKPGNLVVKVKPSTPVTPRGGNPSHPPAAKLARPRTSVPSSLAAGSPSPRLSTPDPRRRPSSHLHRGQPQAQAQLLATPRKENNRLPPPPSAALAAAASPATPRPRTSTMLSRSRSMFKDRGSSSVAVSGESPRPSRFLPPRSTYDGASSNLKEPTPSPRADDAIALVRSSSCSREQTVVADRRKASAVVPEPFLVKRSGNDIEPTSAPLVASKERDLPCISEITPAGCGNADNKSIQQEYVDQSSEKFGSEEITGDSDTEPSYVYIKKDSDEQTPRPPQASDGVGTCPGPEPRSDTDNKEDSDNVEDTMESTGSNEVAGETPAADAEEEFRRESSESLYSNVQSSFSPRSELDTSATGSPLPSATEQSPESNTSPWTGKKSREVEDALKRPPTPTTPRSSVQSPMDAVNGLKRLLTFGKRNGKASDAVAAVERAPHSVAPAPPATAGDDGSVSGECPAGGSAKLTVDSSDDLDNSYVISPHVGSLQSVGPSYPASSELKEPVLHAKSPRVHRSFFSFSSFKSRANRS
ncbi:endochitinase A-like isoform X2 [Miscanthus floridulus]|uniref:endochitinase A-like isoform X2 n=1 Tax=Miscanthus floridulus TaxID=154761 RepID=UPI00345B2F81